MTRVPLFSGGVAWLAPAGRSPEEAASLRELLRSVGNEAETILDPLTLQELAPVYAEINQRYKISLFAPNDLAELRHAIALTAGAYFKSLEAEQARSLIADVEQLLAAIEKIIEFGQIPETGMVDVRRRLLRNLIAEELLKLSGDRAVNRRMEIAVSELTPILPAAGSVVARLAELRNAPGRRAASHLVHYCQACRDALLRIGAPIAVQNEPDPDKPGPLLELATRLQGFLPVKLRNLNLSTWAKRFRAVEKLRQSPKIEAQGRVAKQRGKKPL